MAYVDPSACPPDEVLACLVDGRLAREERAALLRHAADCSRCAFVLADSASWEISRPGRRSSATRIRRAAIAAALVAASGITAWTIARRGPDVADVARATGGERAVLSRLVGAPYQSPPTTYRSRERQDVTSPSLWALAEEAKAAREAVGRRRTPETLRALAAAHMLLGNRDEAVELFTEVAAVAPGADADSDLAAALLARGIQDREPQALVEALESASRALTRRPDHLPASFNRALALEELSLRSEAIAAWEEYLRLDPAGGWADEARRRLALLRARSEGAEGRDEAAAAVDRLRDDPAGLQGWSGSHPAAAARWVRTELFAGWAGAWLEGRGPEAERLLALATAMSGGVAGRTGDRSLAEAFALAASTPDRDRMARVHRQYGAAWRYLEGLAGDSSAASFDVASGDVALLGSGEAEWLRVGSLAAELYRGADPDRLRVRLDAALTTTRGALATAHLHWLRGVVDARRGHFDAAIAELRKASRTFEEAGATSDAAWVRYLESESLQMSGDVAAGWVARSEALRLADEPGGRRPILLLGSAIAASFDGYPEVAAAFEREAFPVLSEGEPAVQVVEAQIWRARFLQQAGRSEEARAALDRAAEGAAELRGADPAAEKALAPLFRLAEALIGAEDPERDLALIDRAMTALGAPQDAYRPVLLERRAALNLALGRPAEARRDLGAVLAAAGRAGSDGSPGRWSEGRDLGRAALERALALDVEVFHDPGRALRTLLRARGGALGRQGDDPIEALRRSLEPGETALVAAVVGETIVTWEVSPVRTAWARADVPKGGVAAALAAWERSWSGPGAGGREGRALAEALLPFWSGGTLPARLRLIPDGALDAVPWAALPVPGTDELLVALTELSIAPFAIAGPLVRTSAAPPVLVVADPETADAAPLAGARDEAAAVGALFPATSLLAGPAATRDRVLAAIPQAEIAHFATHAWAHPRRPALARLSFVPGSDGRSWLQAAEIPDLPLDSTRLVVLAGCSTASAPGAAGSAVFGLAQGFLAAGVPSVLGTLWDVDDEATARLSASFYGEIARSGDPRAALRSAQLEARASGMPPTAWAAFVLLRR